jgi:hypothetical protein
MQRTIILLLVALLVLAGCGDEDNTDNDDGQATPTPSPAVIAPELVALQKDYEDLSQSYAAIADIWHKLEQGEGVRCSNQPEMLQKPEDITRVAAGSSYQPLADNLLAAAIDIENAIIAWRSECQIERSQPDPAVIREGLGYVTDARLALDEAQTLLADIQQPADGD